MMRKTTWTPADVSALMVFRVDQPARVRNLHTAVANLSRAGIGEILLYVSDASLGYKKQTPNATIPPGVRAIYDRADKPLHKTVGYRSLASVAGGKVFALVDVDCVLPSQRWHAAIDRLNAGAEVVYPYDGRFINLTGPPLATVLDGHGRVVDGLVGHSLHNQSCGGAVLIRSDTYWKAGGENEGFCGWGFEDDERYWRYQAMGFQVERLPGCIYHLHHEPSGESRTWGVGNTTANKRLFAREKTRPPAHWKKLVALYL